MSFSGMLVHRCDLVQQGTVIGTDDYGRDIYGESIVPGVKCRADQLRMRSSTDERGLDFILENVIFFSADTPIKEDMTISNVVGIDGNPVLTGLFRIESINTVYSRVRLHHYEVTIQRND